MRQMKDSDLVDFAVDSCFWVFFYFSSNVDTWPPYRERRGIGKGLVGLFFMTSRQAELCNIYCTVF